jgi:hypothetical protein
MSISTDILYDFMSIANDILYDFMSVDRTPWFHDPTKTFQESRSTFSLNFIDSQYLRAPPGAALKSFLNLEAMNYKKS